MPERSKKVARPRDPNQLAYQIMLESTGQVPKYDPLAELPVDPSKNPHAVALGRLGGLKGGAARAEALSPPKPPQIPAKAATATSGQKYIPAYNVSPSNHDIITCPHQPPNH